jgi:hypothetical protein
MFEAVATPAGSRDAGGRCKQREHLPEMRGSGGAWDRSLHGRKSKFTRYGESRKIITSL